MNAAVPVAQATSPDQCTPQEWKARVDLAAAYRIAAHLGWEYLIYNHIAVRVPNEPFFLIKPHDLMFSEVRASQLYKLRLDGAPITFEQNVNTAGFVIHTAVLNARPDIHCTLHVHTIPGTAISAHKKGLLPLSQGAMQFYNRLSYHDFQGFATEAEEAAVLSRDLGPTNKAMILRNHGLLTCGATTTEAVRMMWDLVQCSEAQLLLEASGAEINIPPHELCEAAARQSETLYSASREQDERAFRRIIDAIDTSYLT